MNQRTTAVFYTSGTCNLRCRYCGIDKSPILNDIDQALGKSFKGDYYFNQVKKYFPEKWSLKSIETWGGEPFLHMDRIFPLLHKLIDAYPHFSSMFSSTNFSFPEWNYNFNSLISQFAQYPYRDFTFNLQLSCDGPAYINDRGRGVGVTKKCLKNFNELVDNIKQNFPANVTLITGIKQTLDNESIVDLCNKAKIIEYYDFMEESFISKMRELNFKNIQIFPSIPNTAVPSPVTVEEGKIFAEFCKLCREIEKEHHFKYYNNITPFRNFSKSYQTLYSPCASCGSGHSMIGFLPDNMISVCHEGFTQFVENYKKQAVISERVKNSVITFDKFLDSQKINLCMSEEQYKLHEKKIAYYHQQGLSAGIANIANEILMLAMCGQVDKQYLNHQKAVEAANFISNSTSYCIKDNYNITGSYSLVPVGLLKLLLNGAKEYIEND